MLTDSDKRKILGKLVERMGHYQCPICHGESFTIVDGFLASSLHNTMHAIQTNDSFLPSVALVCSNCGFTSLHNAKVLGLDKDD